MSLSDIDLNNLNTFESGIPHDQFKRLRNEAPVYRHPGRGDEEDYWCITKHADHKHISKNPQLFSSEEKGTMIRDPDSEHLPRLRQIMLNMDPPRHRLYREIVNKAFTPRMVANIETRVDKMVEQIINRVCEKGECDFVDDLAAPLPMQVICEMAQASNGINGRRFIAHSWDENLPIQQRLEKAGAAVAWSQMGQQSVRPK